MIELQLIELQPADLIGPILLFCSDASAFVTGQILTIDGGLTATQ